MKTIQRFIEKVELQFGLFSYNKLRSEMTVLEEQIINMHEISEQLIAMNSDFAPDHHRESL